MAFRLTKKELALRDKVRDELGAAYDKLTTKISECNTASDEALGLVNQAIETFNAERERLFETLDDAVREYNDELNNAREALEDIPSRLRDEFDNKSEKWQNSDRGTEVRSLVDAWEELDFEEVPLDTPVPVDAIEIEDLEDPEALGEALNDLPVEA